MQRRARTPPRVSLSLVYHIELRQFPHNVCRFNLDERALRAIVVPWASGHAIEFGERTWHPQQASLTILEGPHIPLGQLTMGRGWRSAQRDGTDVTTRVLASVGGEAGGSKGSGAAPAGTAGAAHATSQAAARGDAFALGVQMAALLGPDPVGLLDAWRNVAAESPGLAPSEALAAAERAIRAREAKD
jgi:hypothetical protein